LTHKEEPCPSSRDINRLMMMMMTAIFLVAILVKCDRFGRTSDMLRRSNGDKA
jgi:hypothetical protein